MTRPWGRAGPWAPHPWQSTQERNSQGTGEVGLKDSKHQQICEGGSQDLASRALRVTSLSHQLTFSQMTDTLCVQSGCLGRGKVLRHLNIIGIEVIHQGSHS